MQFYNSLLRKLYIHFTPADWERTIKILAAKYFISENYIYFKTNESIEEWGRINFGKWILSVLDEKNTLSWNHHDTFLTKDAIEHYCGFVSRPLNETLRYENESALIERHQEILSLLDDALLKNTLSENIIAFRIMNLSVFNEAYRNGKKFKVGEILYDKGFLSTSLHTEYIYQYANVVTDDYYCKMIIQIPKGSRALYVSTIAGRPAEQELILPRNTALRIKEILIDRKNVLLFLAEVI